jgi:hypothetical protein
MGRISGRSHGKVAFDSTDGDWCAYADEVREERNLGKEDARYSWIPDRPVFPHEQVRCYCLECGHEQSAKAGIQAGCRDCGGKLHAYARILTLVDPKSDDLKREQRRKRCAICNAFLNSHNLANVCGCIECRQQYAALIDRLFPRIPISSQIEITSRTPSAFSVRGTFDFLDSPGQYMEMEVAMQCKGRSE